MNQSFGQAEPVEVRHVLLVDDVNLMCQFLNETLRMIPNVECHTASKVNTAESILRRYPVKLAILDLNLPDGSGLELVKQIRKGEVKGDYDIPILIFTGNTYKETIKQCLMFNVSDIIAKPIVAMELRKRVEANLAKKKKLKPAQYYQDIDRELEKIAPPKAAVKPTSSVVNSRPTASTVRRPGQENKSEDGPSQFIKWPSDATTGYHQLDRRLKDLCFQLNHFHHYRTTKETYPTAEDDIQQIKMCMDDLDYAIKPLKSAKPNEEIWPALQQRLKMLKEVPYKKYSAPKLDSKKKELFAKSLRTAWMSILSKPIIQRKK
jgi:DNA-binding response OmpR family regulator